MQITPAFAVPLIHAHHPDSAKLNADLHALFLEREKQGMSYRNPHPSMQIGNALFESNFDVFSWPETCVQQLNKFCWSILSRTIAQLNEYKAEQMNEIEILSHTWFHITRRGGWFGSHNHPMASWSGVYCVNAGQDDADRPNSGLLHFSNPHHLGGMFLDAGNSHIRAPYNMRGQSFKLTPGQLILFPSWLVHEVMPFHGEGERITVAFNCWFRFKGATENH